MNLSDLSRPLDISDVDFRVQSINNGGYATILAYKDARVDMNRLDEVVGPYGWQRDYKLIDNKLFCGVGIYNPVTNQWIWKWDVGTESNTEAEKGQASDAFKRACFNLGIGRELYDYPIISVKLFDNEFEKKKDGSGREKAFATFNLKIRDWSWYSEFTDDKITFLAAKDQNGNLRFKWGSIKEKVASKPVQVTEESNPNGLLKKQKDVAPDPIVLEAKEKEDDSDKRIEAVSEYMSVFGKKPHGRMSIETIYSEIKAELDSRVSELLIEEEEPNVPQELTQPEETIVEEDIADTDSILKYVVQIESHTDPNDFVAWAKNLVQMYSDIDAADVIDLFKDYCNNHYQKIHKK